MVFHHTSSTVQRKSSLVDATLSDANTGEYNASLPLHHALFHLSNSGVLDSDLPVIVSIRAAFYSNRFSHSLTLRGCTCIDTIAVYYSPTINRRLSSVPRENFQLEKTMEIDLATLYVKNTEHYQSADKECKKLSLESQSFRRNKEKLSFNIFQQFSQSNSTTHPCCSFGARHMNNWAHVEFMIIILLVIVVFLLLFLPLHV
jgi:hypothetical protein